MGHLKKSSILSVRFIFRKIIEFKWLVFSFVLFAFLQALQIAFIQWDKVAYIFGGKWFCGQQMYFEFIRPPLPSFLNCVFGAQDYSMILTTIFACVVYFAAVLIIYTKNKSAFDQKVLALFAFLFPTILFVFNFGSDMLAVAFILLAFAVHSPSKKGIAFALASLSRYNFLIFGIILFWGERKKPKNLLIMGALLVLFWVPWMIFNYLYTGNPFFSIIESTYLNVLNKGAPQPFLIEQIFVIVLFVLSLFLTKIKDSLFDQKSQAGIIAAVMFIFSAVKETRFLGLLTPMLAFNAAKASAKSRRTKIFFMAVAFLSLLAVFVYFFHAPYFVRSISIPQDSFIKDCRVASDNWVFFYDKGIVAEYPPNPNSWSAFVSGGGSIVLYNYQGKDFNGFDVINRGEYVILKSSSCAPQPKSYISGPLRDSVLKWLRDTNSKIYDYSDWVN